MLKTENNNQYKNYDGEKFNKFFANCATVAASSTGITSNTSRNLHDSIKFNGRLRKILSLFVILIISFKIIEFSLFHIKNSKNLIDYQFYLQKQMENVLFVPSDTTSSSINSIKYDYIKLILSLFYSFSFIIFSFMITYLDSMAFGIKRSIQFKQRSKLNSYQTKQISFHIGYITATISGIIVFFITYKND